MAQVSINDKALDQLQQLASMAYGHGSDTAGSGRIGLIGGHVVKFNTHRGERLARTDANSKQAMLRSCDALRIQLGALARDIYAGDVTDGMAKILRDLGLNENGQLVLQKKSLLDRKVVAQFVNQIKADSEDERLSEFRGAETLADSRYQTISSEGTKAARDVAADLKDKLLKELRCAIKGADDTTQKLVNDCVNEIKGVARPFAKFGEIAAKLMTGEKSLAEAKADVANNCAERIDNLSLNPVLLSQAGILTGRLLNSQQGEVPTNVPKQASDLVSLVMNQAQSDMVRELESLAAKYPDSARLGFVRGFARPVEDTRLDQAFNSAWIDLKYKYEIEESALPAHERLHKLEHEILSKTDRLAQSVVGGTMSAADAKAAFKTECGKFGLAKKVAQIIRSAARNCETEASWNQNKLWEQFESDFFAAVAKRFDEMESWCVNDAHKMPLEHAPAEGTQPAKVQPEKVQVSDVKRHFRENCLVDGRCDTGALQKFSLRADNPFPEDLAEKLRLVAVGDENVTDLNRDNILGLLRYVPVEKWFLSQDDQGLNAMYALLKGVAADLGLLTDNTVEDYGEYGGGQLKISFGSENLNVKQAANDTRIPPEFSKQISSVEDNPGAGHCFFYSALKFIEGSTPNSECQVKELRAMLISHAHGMLGPAGSDSHGLRHDGQGWTVPTSHGRVNISQAVRQVEGLGKDEDFSRSANADLTNAAFLADMLKRPVVVLSTELPTDTRSVCFDCELTNGKRLTGEPIYILHTQGHFRAFTPSPEFAAQFGGRA